MLNPRRKELMLLKGGHLRRSSRMLSTVKGALKQAGGREAHADAGGEAGAEQPGGVVVPPDLVFPDLEEWVKENLEAAVRDKPSSVSGGWVALARCSRCLKPPSPLLLSDSIFSPTSIYSSPGPFPIAEAR